MDERERLSDKPSNPRSNALTLALAIAFAIIVGGVFFARFVAARIVLERLLPAATAATLVVAASIGCGSLAIALASRLVVRMRGSENATAEVDPADEFLVGVSILGTVLSLIALVALNPLIVFGVTLIAATFGAVTRWRRVLALLRSLSIRRGLVLLPPIVLAFLGAITPVNTPDELVYKLALPKMYLLFGRMLELPLHSYSYLPSSVSMADLTALVLSGGIAAKLVHFAIYLVVLRVIRRTSSLWATAVIAWTPALALIAGWAWAEWAMIGFVLLSFVRWQEFLDSRDGVDLAISACALGAALATKYTALPWLVVFLPLACWRARAWRPLAAAAVIVIAVGGLFYVRNVIWTGSPIAPFLLPDSPDITEYRSTAGGWTEIARGYDIFHEGIIDDSVGVLLPVMLLLSPFALVGRSRRAIDLFVIGAGQLVMLVPLAPTARLIALALVPLALLGAMAVERAWTAIASGTMRIALAAVAGLAFFGQLLLVLFVFTTMWHFMPYVVGAESEDVYLRRTRDYSAAYAWITEHTHEDAKLLLVAETRTFHLDRRAIAAGNLDGPRMAAHLARFASIDALQQEVAREGFTHVVVHKPWYRVATPGSPALRMLEKEYVLTVTPQTHAVLRQFLDARARLVYEDAAYAIYELRR